ncbi:hypothetical protein GCM10010415_07800 [Streptomyces atrovirens]
MVPFATARSGSPALVAYRVFMSRQPECPKGLEPVKRIRYQYRNVQSYDAG